METRKPLRIAELSPRQGSWWTVRLEDGRHWLLTDRSVAALQLAPGKEMSLRGLEVLSQKAEEDQVYEVALRLLARQPRSRHDVSQKLRARGFSPSAIHGALISLEKAGYVDDHAFAAAWIRNTLSRDPRGQRRLIFELTKKGVSREIAQRAVEEVFAERNPDGVVAAETDLAKEFLTKNLRDPAWRQDARRRARLISQLRRRGFTWDVIRSILREWGWEVPLA